MIYLASPYSAAPNRNVLLTARAATALHQKGFIVFSPILHWHHAAQWAGLPGDAQFWWPYNKHMLSLANDLMVLAIDGWESSRGVQMEINWWNQNRPLTPFSAVRLEEILEPEDDGENH